jgi:pimeloyl-ACP methyl ester carboxylesterase
MNAPYSPRRSFSSRFLDIRGLRYRLITWGDPALVTPELPPLVMLHGWMDVAASFQFVVDAMAADRYILAPDWRGFGLSEAPRADTYWFPDYLGDLEALLDAALPGAGPIDLLGHSMGGNAAMLYAGVRPERIRRLVNLEGFGMPQTRPESAPARYARWLDELKEPQSLRDYASLDEVASRLRKNNPRLTQARAAWLAGHWSRRREDGRYEILGDPAHKRGVPILYRVEEVLACWSRIAAPVLWVEGEATQLSQWWGERYTRAEFQERLKSVPKVEQVVIREAAHMLHHDQPEQLATHLEAFL